MILAMTFYFILWSNTDCQKAFIYVFDGETIVTSHRSMECNKYFKFNSICVRVCKCACECLLLCGG